MKKLALILAAILAVSLLVSCSGAKKTAGDTQAQTEEKLPALKAAADVSLAPLAEAMKGSGILGDNTTYLAKGDEYAEDTLMFTYGIEEYEAINVKNFLVSEHGSNEAYTCAVLLFDGELEQSTFSMLSERLDTYADELKSAVAPYNPEAAGLCADHVIRILEIRGEDATVRAVCLFISDDNAALENIVSEQLTSILAAN